MWWAREEELLFLVAVCSLAASLVAQLVPRAPFCQRARNQVHSVQASSPTTHGPWDRLSTEPCPRAPRLGPSVTSPSSAWRAVAWRYLPVYVLGTLGDWMQGGHLYALYRTYGYSITHIGHIFAIGYTSAAILGTYAAAFGDRCGYRACVVIYGMSYSIVCGLMNWPSTALLVAGRVIGGVSYSLLYVSFESWLVAETFALQLPEEKLGDIFATATTVNAASAVLGGILAHVSLEMGRGQGLVSHGNIYVAPFNAAIVPLLGCSALACVLWSERFGRIAKVSMADAWPRPNGQEQRPQSTTESLAHSWSRLLREPVLLHLGILSSLYEAVLYAFVFLWTPALEFRSARAGRGEIEHGKIFSLMMLFKAVGSRVFAVGLSALPLDTRALTHAQHAFAVRALKFAFASSAAALSVPIWTGAYAPVLGAFCVFEMLLGFYWPAVAILRTEFLSEGRSSMMSVFRVLLNLLVIGVLELSGFLSEALMFFLTVAMLLACCVSTTLLDSASRRVKGSLSDDEARDDVELAGLLVREEDGSDEEGRSGGSTVSAARGFRPRGGSNGGKGRSDATSTSTLSTGAEDLSTFVPKGSTRDESMEPFATDADVHAGAAGSLAQHAARANSGRVPNSRAQVVQHHHQGAGGVSSTHRAGKKPRTDKPALTDVAVEA